MVVYKFLKFVKRYIDIVLAPFLRFIYRLGVRPNYITLVSIPCGLLGVVLLFQGDMLSGFLIPLYIVLDVLDGSLARVTGSVSEFGDKLDFLGDRAVASLFLILFYVNGGDALFSITGLILISAVTLEDLGLIKRRTK